MEVSSTESSSKRSYWDLASRTGTYAADWYSSMTTWLGDWIAPEKSVGQGRSDASRVAETLLAELVHQGRMLEEKKQQKEKASLASTGVADYRFK
jgi:hemolysin-activating ACP:hemolysin acyltransferase